MNILFLRFPFCSITQKDDLAGYNTLGLQLFPPQSAIIIASFIFF
jgi:hypothetical protein